MHLPPPNALMENEHFVFPVHWTHARPPEPQAWFVSPR